MKVRSTGLGKTTLISKFEGLEVLNEGEDQLKLIIETSKPVHWKITIMLQGADIKDAFRLVMRPTLIFRVLRLLLRRSPSQETVPVEHI